MKLNKSIVMLCALLASGATLMGCTSLTPNVSGATYNLSHTRQVHTLHAGVVQHVRAVTIDGTRSKIGPVAGAVVSGVLGATLADTRSRLAIGSLAGLAGGLAGQAIEQRVTRQTGLEIQVLLDDGRTVLVTQANDEAFYPGERVRVITGGSVVRVSH